MAASTTGPQGPDYDETTANLTAEEDEARIAGIWHRACPSLRTIILPKGKVWFQSAQTNLAQPNTDAATTAVSRPTSTSSTSTIPDDDHSDLEVIAIVDNTALPDSSGEDNEATTENDRHGGWAHL